MARLAVMLALAQFVFTLAQVASGGSLGVTSAQAAAPSTPIPFFRKDGIFKLAAGEHPTTVAVGPDGRVYLGGVNGKIYALTVDATRNVTASAVYNTIYNTPTTNADGTPATDAVGRQLTGMTFDPASTAAQPVLYVTHSDPRVAFNNNPPAGSINTHSGTITRLTGPNLDAAGARLDVVTGLPRSRHNHSTNGIRFGPDGWLYISQGGNQNLGGAGQTFSYLPEFCDSSAILRANVRSITATLDTSANSVSTGTCNLAPNPGVFEVYATGVRNSYDLLWHSNGNLYANVNGSNNTLGMTPGPSDGCPGTTAIDPPNQPDLFLRVAPGKFYGYPNPARHQCVAYDGTLYAPALAPDPNYAPPMSTYGTYNNGGVSVDGMTQYPLGAMAGDIISATYSGDRFLRRNVLNADGSLNTIIAMSDVGPYNNPLGIASDSQGAIYIAEYAENSGTPQLSVLLPPALTPLAVTAVSPLSGPTAGGNGVTLNGSAFASGDTVTFGGVAATGINVVSSTVITVIAPAHAAGSADVVVSHPSGVSATLAGGYLYTAPGSFSPIRLNAGGGSYFGGTNNNWAPDTGFTGGGTFTTTSAIAGTPDQPLYQTERSATGGGNFNYSFTVPNGTYTVTLKFAEIYWTQSGQRIFNVAIGGQPVLTNFDIVGQSAPFTALDKTFVTSVSTGTLSIDFSSVKDNAKVSAIQVTAGAPVPTVVSTAPSQGATAVSVATPIVTTFSQAMDSGSTQAAFSISPAAAGTFSWDGTGSVMTFTPNAPLAGKTAYTASIAATARNLAGATLGAASTWSFTTGPAGQPVVTSISPVSGPVAGGTAVTLTGSSFASGASVTFGGTAATNVLFPTANSITATAPAHTAGTVDVVVTNPNGQIGTLPGGFSYLAPAGIATSRVRSGGGAYTDTTGNVWQADSSFSGGATFTNPVAVTGTPDQGLYQAERYGNFTYTINVPNSAYEVILKEAELWWTAPGQRVFNVAVNGQAALTNFDIVAKAGARAAYDVRLPANVTNGTLTISFTSVVDNAKVDAIALVPLTVGAVSPAQGSAVGGNSATISGTGFVPGATVNFGGAAVGGAAASSVTVVDDRTIVAVVPTHLITHVHPVDVTVTNPGGGTYSLVNGYRYLYPVPVLSSISPNTARAGGPAFTLTVTGDDFVNSISSLTWNGTAISTVVVNQTQLTATVPATDIASTGTASVAVVNTDPVPGGGGTSVSATFTVNTTGVLPGVTAISPATGPTTGGTAVTITGSGFSGATAVKFGAVAATAFTVGSDSTITATSPASIAGVFDVIVATPSGNTPPATADRFTYVSTQSFQPIRVHAGGGAYTDLAGNAWSADTGFAGGGTFSTTAAISGTTDQPLYQTERSGSGGASFSYAFNVPNGTYTLTLKMAEIYWTQAGQRVFNVTANGRSLLTNFDIVASVAPNTAVDRTFVVAVSGGTLSLQFSSTKDNATVSAIQVVSGGTLPPPPTVGGITPNSGSANGATSVTISGTNFVAGASVSFGGAPGASVVVASATSLTAVTTAHPAATVDVVVTNPDGQAAMATAAFTFTTPTTFIPIRVHSGGAAYTDSLGHAWSADTGFTGGGVFSSAGAIAGTADQALYQTERFGNMSYGFALPNGTYTVNLKFAELYWTQPGQRVFNVTANGAALLTNFDILASVAPRTALDRSFVVSVTGGLLNVGFTTVKDNAKISAIEVIAGGTPPPPPTFSTVRLNAGGPAYTDKAGLAWSADTGFSGGGTFSSGAAIAGTTDPSLYQSERSAVNGGSFTYGWAVPDGAYTITLKFAEIWWTQPQQRIFNVSANGSALLTNFDIVAQAPPNTALDKTFHVTVSGGMLTLTFQSVKDNAKVSAIQVVAG